MMPYVIAVPTRSVMNAFFPEYIILLRDYWKPLRWSRSPFNYKVTRASCVPLLETPSGCFEPTPEHQSQACKKEDSLKFPSGGVMFERLQNKSIKQNFKKSSLNKVKTSFLIAFTILLQCVWKSFCWLHNDDRFR